MEQVGHRGDLGDGPGELAGVLDERLHVAEGHGPAGDPQPAQYGDDHVVEVPDEHRDRHDQTGQELGSEAGLEQLVVLDFEGGLDFPLAAEHLDEGMAGEGFLDLGVEGAGRAPLGDELALGPFHDQAGDHHRHRDRHQGDEGEGGGDVDHHPDHEHDRQHRGEQLAHRLLEALGDVVDVVGYPAQEFTARLAVEVTEREPVELVFDFGTHPQHRVLDDVVEQVSLQESQQGGEGVEADHDEEDRAERVEVDALAGDQVDAADQVGELVLPLGPGGFDRLCFAESGRQVLADEPGEDHVGGPSQHFGAGGGEGDADHSGHDHGDDLGTFGAEPLDEPFDGGAEIERLLADHAASERAAPSVCRRLR